VTDVVHDSCDRRSTSVDLLQIAGSLAKTIDFVSPALRAHQQTTAFVALRTARALGLSAEECRQVYTASLLHDCGSVFEATGDRLALLEFDEITPHRHARAGAQLLERVPLLADAARLVRHHHVPWDDRRGESWEGEEVSPLSHLVHLADRMTILLERRSDDPLQQVPMILERLRAGSGSRFNPEHVAAFAEASAPEEFWFSLTYGVAAGLHQESMELDPIPLTLDQLLGLSEIFFRLIDSRSIFTADHSRRVSEIAALLAAAAGYADTVPFRVAGMLHDLGKLAVSMEIIEKNGRLTPQEINIVKRHPYFTWEVLRDIGGLEELARWAALHHETLDGRGYPFRLPAGRIPTEARILAIADLVAALGEHRPYRSGFDAGKIKESLVDRAASGLLDKDLVALAVANLDDIMAQSEFGSPRERPA